MAPPGFLILGRVLKVTGVRGEVKVACFADSWEPFRNLDRLWLSRPDGSSVPLPLEWSREHGRSVTLKLTGVDSPEAATGLIGCEVAIPREMAPPPPEGVFYHYDILGLRVMEEERLLGTVREIVETPAHDVYVVQGPAGEWMLPATRTHIRRIDLPGKRIEIEAGMDLVNVTSGGEEGAEAV
jgi:16S rRNA processing protein RimM